VVSRATPLLASPKQLLSLAKQVQSDLGAGETAIMLGGVPGPEADKVSIVVLLSKAAVARNLSAAELIRKPAESIGGGGGGSAEMAQAGGGDSGKLGEAFDAARRMIEERLG
jgi:alanyl-tRNA synthetase